LSLLNKIAVEVSPSLGGVNWASLEAQLGMPREEIVYDIDAKPTAGVFLYVEDIRAAKARADRALQNFVFSWSVEDNPATAANEISESMAAWRAVQSESIAVGDQVLSALRAQAPFLREDSEFLVEQEKLRAIVSSTYYTTLYGSVVHAHAFLQREDVAPEDIVQNADAIVKTFNGLAQMAEMGVLNSLMRVPATPPAPGVAEEVVEGTGAIPVGVVIAIAVVLAVAIIAWCIVTVSKQQEVNRALRLMCDEAARTGTTEDKDRCAELVRLSTTADSGVPDLAGGAKSIGEAAVMVALAYGAFMLIPPLVSAWKMKQKQTETRRRMAQEWA
jgi:hypothetical protein